MKRLATFFGKERHRKTLWAAFLLLAPNLLGFLVFTLGPVLVSLGMSFTDWNLARHTSGVIPIEFVGFKNYADMLGFHRDPLSPPTRFAGLWLAVFFALVALLLATLYALWRLRRPRGLGDSNPGLLYFASVLVGSCLLASVAESAWLGTLAAHPRLGVMWPYAKLFAAAFCLGACVWRLWTGHDGRERVRLQLLSLAILSLPGFYVLITAVGRQTFAYWQPNTPWFWLYLYNTVYLMLGLPFGIAGALGMALLLHRTAEVAGWWRRIILAGAFVVGCPLIVWLLLPRVTKIPVDFMALVLLFGVVCAIGVLFGTTGFRTVFYLPSLTMGVASFILWQKMLNPEAGPINNFLRWLFATRPFHLLEAFARWWDPSLGPDWRLVPPEWLQSVAWAKPALIVMGLWGAVGSGTMLLYLAALSNISRELYEAADVDGASRWQRFWSVTWPQLAPTTFFVVIMGCIGGLQGGFEQARVMTNGGPARSTTTISYYLFTEAFDLSNMGYACAIAWVLFALVFLLTIINWRFGNQVVNYE
jgi:multiple sugar transport system permease protein